MWIFFLIVFNMKVCFVFSQGDSNEYTQYTIFDMNKKKHPKLSQNCSYGLFFPRDSRMSSKQLW